MPIKPKNYPNSLVFWCALGHNAVMKDIIMTTGKNIKALRVSRGLTQISLAKMIPMDQAFLSRIERGVQEPSLEMLGKIANALGCDSSELMKGREEETSTALVPVFTEEPNEQNSGQNIVIERQRGDTTIRYILPPTAQTYEFLAEQLNRAVPAENLDIPDNAVVVKNNATANNSSNCNNVTVGTKKQ